MCETRPHCDTLLSGHLLCSFSWHVLPSFAVVSSEDENSPNRAVKTCSETGTGLFCGRYPCLARPGLWGRNFPSSSPHDAQQIANSHHWSPVCCIASFVPADLLVGSIMSLRDINCIFIPVHAVLRFTHLAALTKLFALNICVYFILYSHHLEHCGSFASWFAPKPVSRLKQKRVIYPSRFPPLALSAMCVCSYAGRCRFEPLWEMAEVAQVPENTDQILANVNFKQSNPEGWSPWVPQAGLNPPPLLL